MNIDRLAASLSSGGIIASSLPDFEARPQQIEMVRAIGEAFTKAETVVIEAPTGIGKSLAYLIPAIEWTLANDERIVISTNTINLQEQLIRKDIPFLEKVLGLDLKVAVLKGRSNYICLRRLALYPNQNLLFGTVANEIETINEWISDTIDGSKSDLSINPSGHVWEAVCSDKDRCQGNQCHSFSECFFNNARRKAGQARIIIVNHHLLLSDLSVKINTSSEGAVIPDYSSLIVDEAHHLEAVAQRHLGGTLAINSVTKIIGELTGRVTVNGKTTGGGNPGILTTVLSMTQGVSLFSNSCDVMMGRECKTAIKLTSFLEEETKNLKDILAASIGTGATPHSVVDEDFAETSRWTKRIKPAIEKVYGTFTTLSLSTGHIGKLLKDRADYSPESSLGNLSNEFERISSYLSTFASFCSRFINTLDKTCCRWYEVTFANGGKNNSVRLNLCPFDVSETLEHKLFAELETTVITSATLCVNNSFDYITNTLGITMNQATCIKLESPFNYEDNMFLGIPVNIAAPGTSFHIQQITKVIQNSVAMTGGRAFILFTSYKMMHEVYDALEEDLLDKGCTPLLQGNMSREHILEAFSEEPSPVLFGTSSFWEGVDVKGDALVLVIIVKLPFQVPTDPFVAAKGTWLKKRGLDPFRDDSLPKAVIALKQGVGRLIRSSTDAGIILILDKRIATKGYGRQFLSSLPQLRPAKGNWREIEAAMEQFVDQKL
jgi:ATP-dependent DNA helicase DinG